MNIYEYLKKDHEKVASLFFQFEHANCSRYQAQIFSLIREELILHIISEEATFYKALEKFKISRDDAAHAEIEHSEITLKLQKIGVPLKISSELREEILNLKKLVEHHVREEEMILFDEARKMLSDEEAWVIKEQMHAYKERILSSEEENLII